MYFDEGVSCHQLEISSKSKISEIETNKNLVQYFYSKSENLHHYRIISKSKPELLTLKNNLDNSHTLESIELRYLDIS